MEFININVSFLKFDFSIVKIKSLRFFQPFFDNFVMPTIPISPTNFLAPVILTLHQNPTLSLFPI